MKTPKLLPWYAHRAGVSIERAEAIWCKAVREATEETGWVGNSEYWGASMSHFQRLLDEEKATLCAPRMAPLMRSQRRLLRLPLIALEDFVTAMHSNWQRSNGAVRKAV